MRGFLFFALIVLVGGTGLALYLHWVNVAVVHNDDGSQSSVQVTLDKEKVKEDVAMAQEKIQDLGKKVPEGDKSPSAKTVKGTIRNVESERLTLAVIDGEPLTVRLTPDTKITFEGKEGRVSDLRPGQEATCVHVNHEGTEFCQSLTVGMPKQ